MHVLVMRSVKLLPVHSCMSTEAVTVSAAAGGSEPILVLFNISALIDPQNTEDVLFIGSVGLIPTRSVKVSKWTSGRTEEIHKIA